MRQRAQIEAQLEKDGTFRTKKEIKALTDAAIKEFNIRVESLKKDEDEANAYIARSNKERIAREKELTAQLEREYKARQKAAVNEAGRLNKQGFTDAKASASEAAEAEKAGGIGGLAGSAGALAAVYVGKQILDFQYKAVEAYAKTQDALRVLKATALDTGQTFESLTGGAEEFGRITSQNLADATKAYAKLAEFSKEVNRPQDLSSFSTAFANVGAAHGVEGKDLDQAAQQLALLQERRIKKLLVGTSIKQVYAEYAKSLSTTSEKLDDAAKKQALFNEILKQGSLFEGEAAKRLDETAGKLDRLSVAGNKALNALGYLISDSAVGKATSFSPNLNPIGFLVNEVPKTINLLEALYRTLAKGDGKSFDLLSQIGGVAAEGDGSTQKLRDYQKEEIVRRTASFQKDDLADAIKHQKDDIESFQKSLAAPQINKAIADLQNQAGGEGATPDERLKSRLANFQIALDKALAEGKNAYFKFATEDNADFEQALKDDSHDAGKLRVKLEALDADNLIDPRDKAKLAAQFKKEIKEIEDGFKNSVSSVLKDPNSSVFDLKFQLTKVRTSGDQLTKEDKESLTDQLEKAISSSVVKSYDRVLKNPALSLDSLLGQLTSVKDNADLTIDAKNSLVDSITSRIKAGIEQAKNLVNLLHDSQVSSAAADNPLIKALDAYATAADRARVQFKLLGEEAIALQTKLNQAAALKDINKLVYNNQKNAVNSDFEASKLANLRDDQTDGFERRLKLVDANLKFISEQFDLERKSKEADFYANKFNPNNPKSYDESRFSYAQLDKFAEGSSADNRGAFTRESIKIADAVEELKKLQQSPLFNTGLAGSAEAAKEIISKIPSREELLERVRNTAGNDINRGNAKYLLKLQAEAEETLKRDSERKFKDLLANNDLVEEQRNRATDLVRNVGKSKLTPSEQRAEILAITKELGTAELTPELRRAAIKANKDDAIEDRNLQRKATAAAEAILKEFQDLKKQIKDKGLPVDFKEQPLINMKVIGTTEIKTEKRVENKAPNQSDVEIDMGFFPDGGFGARKQ